MPFSLDAGSLMQILWLVLLIIFAASEAVTVGLTSIWFAAGALVALLAALLGGPMWVQITLFLAVSLLCLAARRPGRGAHRRRHPGAGAAHRGCQGVRGAHRRPGVRRGAQELVTCGIGHNI